MATLLIHLQINDLDRRVNDEFTEGSVLEQMMEAYREAAITELAATEGLEYAEAQQRVRVYFEFGYLSTLANLGAPDTDDGFIHITMAVDVPLAFTYAHTVDGSPASGFIGRTVANAGSAFLAMDGADALFESLGISDVTTSDKVRVGSAVRVGDAIGLF